MKPGNIVWIWGMSGSGKTTLGSRLAQKIEYLFLDSDAIRKVLGAPDNFSTIGRIHYQESLRGYVKDLQRKNNGIIVASITPLQEMRNANAKTFSNYFEFYLKCDLDTLIKRDPKGLYNLALRGGK